MQTNHRARIAAVIYEIWQETDRPQIIAAEDILERYRREIGDLSPELLGEELYLMEDDSGSMPFFRVAIPSVPGEMGNMSLKDINPERLRELAAKTGTDT